MGTNALTEPRAFERALGVVLVLNILDAVCTTAWVSTGLLTEGNPIMAAAMGAGFGPFVLGKVALVGLGIGLLYRLREEPMARIAFVPAALLYSFVMGNHLGIGAMVAGLV